MQAGSLEQSKLGRPRDMTGGREERREDARTPEGENATGAEGEGEEEH
ncbi:MAG: hypothetical protein JKY65_24015 [Planctomycetes bacterium]|nr:hypothetical protein [Planctomycetota bacterium]